MSNQVDVSFAFTEKAEKCIRQAFDATFLKLNMTLQILRLGPTLLKLDVRWTDPFMRVPNRNWSLSIDTEKVDNSTKMAEVMGNFMVDVQKDLQKHAAVQIEAKRRDDARKRR